MERWEPGKDVVYGEDPVDAGDGGPRDGRRTRSDRESLDILLNDTLEMVPCLCRLPNGVSLGKDGIAPNLLYRTPWKKSLSSIAIQGRFVDNLRADGFTARPIEVTDSGTGWTKIEKLCGLRHSLVCDSTSQFESRFIFFLQCIVHLPGRARMETHFGTK